MRSSYFGAYIIALTTLMSFPFELAAQGNTEPIVVVIHGIGGPRSDGWSHSIQKQWGVKNVREITFGYRGRNWRSGLTDFSKRGGQWAQLVKNRLTQIARRHPTRKIMVVAHSWGSVATKIALSGGQAGQRVVSPLRGVKVHRLITLGSPLGLAKQSASGGALGKLGVRVNSGRPSSVGQWVNVYDPSDPVSKSSWRLRGAVNKSVTGSGYRADPTGISYHTGIWTNPWVSNFIKSRVKQLAGPKRLAAKAPINKDRILARLARLSPQRLHQILRQANVSTSNMRCLCKQVPHGNVSVYYSLKPSNASPSCKNLKNGPCVFQGFGCFRGKLPTTQKALKACEIDRSVALTIGGARSRAGHRNAWKGSQRRKR